MCSSDLVHFLELEPHFAEEEVMFAPYWQNIPAAMRERFEKEHAKLRGMMANPKYLNEEWNKDFCRYSARPCAL